MVMYLGIYLPLETSSILFSFHFLSRQQWWAVGRSTRHPSHAMISELGRQPKVSEISLIQSVGNASSLNDGNMVNTTEQDRTNSTIRKYTCTGTQLPIMICFTYNHPIRKPGAWAAVHFCSQGILLPNFHLSGREI